jgi:hypothetical protein
MEMTHFGITQIEITLECVASDDGLLGLERSLLETKVQGNDGKNLGA